MKTFGKALANKIATVVVLLLVVVGGYFWWQNQKKSEVTAEYSFIVKKFNKKSELVVADADVQTNVNKSFESKALKDWPKWIKPVTKLFVGRNMKVEIPVKTEFKLVLEDISRKDITVKDNVLTFNNPITVKVDSQKVGEITIVDSSGGLFDRAADAVTAGEKAQEFLEAKSQDAIFKASNHVMNKSQYQKKVAKYAEENLEEILNLNSDEKLTVKIKSTDLKFKNIDSRK